MCMQTNILKQKIDNTLISADLPFQIHDIDNDGVPEVINSYGEVTASALAITGGTINIGDKFKVDSKGNITASGTIKLGDNFSVDTNGNVTANSITLTGTLTMETYDPYYGTTSTQTIDAYTLADGAMEGYDWGANSGDVWNGVVNGNNAAAEWESAHDSYIGAGDIYVDNLITSWYGGITCNGTISLGGDFWYGGYKVDWISVGNRMVLGSPNT